MYWCRLLMRREIKNILQDPLQYCPLLSIHFKTSPFYIYIYIYIYIHILFPHQTCEHTSHLRACYMYHPYGYSGYHQTTICIASCSTRNSIGNRNAGGTVPPFHCSELYPFPSWHFYSERHHRTHPRNLRTTNVRTATSWRKVSSRVAERWGNFN
jgi:hypothetical protein